MSFLGTPRSDLPQASVRSTEAVFHGLDARTGAVLPGTFVTATPTEVDGAAQQAHSAFAALKRVSGPQRAALLRLVATKLETTKSVVIERAHLETALPVARLQGEIGRTVGQLRMFADLVEEGSWVDARIDTANTTRQPQPKPDVRSMLRPLGPVVVFGASNFPLAFSVAGGDTAAALAAGCPVLVKAHPAHPGTSQIVGRLISEAVEELGFPAGTFTLLFDSGYEVGHSLVRNPFIKAVAFTGSRRGGQALMKIAAARPDPIPVFAEMSSINPVFLSPGSLAARSEEIAAGIQAAVTLGVGQFCTNPGLVFVPIGEDGDNFVAQLTALLKNAASGTMLTAGITEIYRQGTELLGALPSVKTLLRPTFTECGVSPGLFKIQLADFIHSPKASDEIFGPSTLLVRYASSHDLPNIISGLEGQLTATVHLENHEAEELEDVLAALEDKVGRLIVNGYPTGVDVGPAMVHGGPFPATSDGQSSSVGTRAITRFTRPVCYQNFPNASLPAELQAENPLGISRLVDGVPDIN